METTDYMDDIVNRAIEEQNHKYREAASDLNIWHCPSLTSQNFWKLLNATAQAIMAQRGVYHAFVVDDNNDECVTVRFEWTAPAMLNTVYFEVDSYVPTHLQRTYQKDFRLAKITLKPKNTR